MHRRVYIVPARLGWMFGGTLGILLVGSINYALSLGFALTFLLAGLGLAGMVHTARNLARIAVSAGRAEPVFAGEAAQFRLYLDGRARVRPARDPRAPPRARARSWCVDVPARRRRRGGARACRRARRGWLPLGRVMLETRFPLGLFRAWSYVEPDARCLVYPRPERSPLPPSSGRGGGRRAARADARAATTSPACAPTSAPIRRATSPGRRWRAATSMLTKQFAGEAAAELWLDWQLLPAGLGARAAPVAPRGLGARRRARRRALRPAPARASRSRPARGDAHRAACLQALALYQTS